MRRKAVMLLTLLVGGCAAVRSFDAQIISGDANQVAVKAGINANPGKLASEHCARFLKTPKLVETSGNMSGYSVDKTQIFMFECRDVNWSGSASQVNEKLSFGQTKDDVRRIVGAPVYVIGEGRRKVWFYNSANRQDVYFLLLFENGILANVAETSTAEIRHLLKE